MGMGMGRGCWMGGSVRDEMRRQGSRACICNCVCKTKIGKRNNNKARPRATTSHPDSCFVLHFWCLLSTTMLSYKMARYSIRAPPGRVPFLSTHTDRRPSSQPAAATHGHHLIHPILHNPSLVPRAVHAPHRRVRIQTMSFSWRPVCVLYGGQK